MNKFRMTRECYLSNLKNVEKFENKELGAVYYLYDTFSDNPALMAFKGRAQKPTINCYFSSEERRAQTVKEFLYVLQRRKDERAAQSVKRKEYTHNYKIGDILSTSWGYDQTQVEFYQVTKINTLKTITVCRIASDVKQTMYDQGTATPCKNAFIGGEYKRTVSIGGHIGSLDYSQGASAWSGSPCYVSWGR